MFVRRRLTGLNRRIWEWEKRFRFVSRINNYDFTSGLLLYTTMWRFASLFQRVSLHFTSLSQMMMARWYRLQYSNMCPISKSTLAATGGFWRQKIWINVLFSEKNCEYFRKLQFLTRTKSLLKITFRYSFYSRCLIAGGVARESNDIDFFDFTLLIPSHIFA